MEAGAQSDIIVREGGKQIQRVNDGWGQGHSQLVYSARGANRFKFVLEIYKNNNSNLPLNF